MPMLSQELQVQLNQSIAIIIFDLLQSNQCTTIELKIIVVNLFTFICFKISLPLPEQLVDNHCYQQIWLQLQAGSFWVLVV